jgi:organic hydroperoxide reductase OsmC/OhrA
MPITARVRNNGTEHAVEVGTDGRIRPLTIPAKASGGSDVNGGELLFLALATCYCNDLYREAANAGITIDGVEVTVEGEFGGPGEAAKSIRYAVDVTSVDDPVRVRELIRHTDTVAEIHKTVRLGCAITFLGESEIG